MRLRIFKACVSRVLQSGGLRSDVAGPAVQYTFSPDSRREVVDVRLSHKMEQRSDMIFVDCKKLRDARRC